MNTKPSPPPPLVQVQDLALRFEVSAPWLNRVLARKPRQSVQALEGVSFSIARGQTLALVGESGCGKSTLARVLVGLYTPTHGRFMFDGLDAHAVYASRDSLVLRSRIQMLFQDPYASLNPRWRVADIVIEPLREQLLQGRTQSVQQPTLNASELATRAVQLLAQVGLSARDLPHYPHQFSGGQRQRIALARALASRPEFLVCDEPTAALDVSLQAQVLNLMKTLQAEHGLTYLFISHNLAVVQHMADQVGVMYLGRLVEHASKSQLFAAPLHPYTRLLLAAIPTLQRRSERRSLLQGEVPNPLNPPAGCAFHPRCPHAQARCRNERPDLLPHAASAPVRWVACHAVQEGRDL